MDERNLRYLKGTSKRMIANIKTGVIVIGMTLESDEEISLEDLKSKIDWEPSFTFGEVECLYSRTGSIEFMTGACDKCGLERAVLYTDSSEGEYGGISICQECISEGFKEFSRIK